MKRFASWAVVLLASLAEYYISLYYLKLTFWLDNLIGGLNHTLYIVLFIFVVLPMYGGMLAIPFYGSMIVPSLSQAVYKSRKGMRYITFGVLGILYYGFFILGAIVGFVKFSGFGHYLLLISVVLYHVLLIFLGRQQAKEGGGPPSKREQLQQKLDKEISREQHENAVRLVKEAEQKGVDVKVLIEQAEAEKK